MSRNDRVALLLRAVLLACAGWFALPAFAADTAGSGCDETCLKGFANDYIAAMLSKNTAKVPLAVGAVLTENALPVKLGDGIWKTARKMLSTISSNQYVIDAQTGQVAFMGVLDDAGQPAMLALRLSVQNGRITQAETLVGHASDGPFWPEGFIYREAPYIRAVPDSKRNTREELLATDDIYWKTITTTHDGNAIPYAEDCWHFENGMNTNWERPLLPEEAANPNLVSNKPQEYDGRIWDCAREVYLTTRSWTEYKGLHQLVDPVRGLVMSWVLVNRGPGRAGPGGKAGSPPMQPPRVVGFYGPPTRGADGWPEPSSFDDPNKAPVMSGNPDALIGWQYQACLMRIVGGRITRDQTFQAKAPTGASLPY